jgi:hypothetical protein
MKLLASVLLIGILMGAVVQRSALGQDGGKARKLTLKLRQKVSSASPLQNAVYLHGKGPELIASGGYSPDNGRTWEPLAPKPDFETGLPHGYRRERHPLFADTGTGRIVSILNSMDTPGVDPAAVEPAIALKTYYLRYRVSKDGGKTYLFDEPIVQKGAYTPEHPIEGVWKGKNALFMGDAGSTLLRTRAGKILVPAQACVLGPDGALSSPGGGFTYTDVVVLIGTWKKDGRLEWEASQRVQGDPARSTRGMIEPTITEMPDGRLLMVMRGSNGGSKDPQYQIPGYKWYSISPDGGYHWSKPEPWAYTGGVAFHSPSSMSQLLRHSSGRRYWIGNISPANPKGNAPRYPLVIGEVDPKAMMLIKDSVLVIDEPRPEDTEGVELCAHAAAFEDRETGDIMLPMLRYTGGYKKSEPYLYRIGTR